MPAERAERIVDLSLFDARERKAIARLAMLLLAFPPETQEELLRTVRSLPPGGLRALAGFELVLSEFRPQRRELLVDFVAAGDALVGLDHPPVM